MVQVSVTLPWLEGGWIISTSLLLPCRNSQLFCLHRKGVNLRCLVYKWPCALPHKWTPNTNQAFLPSVHLISKLRLCLRVCSERMQSSFVSAVTWLIDWKSHSSILRADRLIQRSFLCPFLAASWASRVLNRWGVLHINWLNAQLSAWNTARAAGSNIEDDDGGGEKLPRTTIAVNLIEAPFFHHLQLHSPVDSTLFNYIFFLNFLLFSHNFCCSSFLECFGVHQRNAWRQHQSLPLPNFSCRPSATRSRRRRGASFQKIPHPQRSQLLTALIISWHAHTHSLHPRRRAGRRNVHT